MVEVRQLVECKVAPEQQHISKVRVYQLHEQTRMQFNVHSECLSVLIVEDQHTMAGDSVLRTLFSNCIRLEQLAALLVIDEFGLSYHQVVTWGSSAIPFCT